MSQSFRPHRPENTNFAAKAPELMLITTIVLGVAIPMLIYALTRVAIALAR